VAVGIESQAACLVDGPTNDYESWDMELHEGQGSTVRGCLRVSWVDSFDAPLRQYRTEAAISESREVVILMSGMENVG